MKNSLLKIVLGTTIVTLTAGELNATGPLRNAMGGNWGPGIGSGIMKCLGSPFLGKQEQMKLKRESEAYAFGYIIEFVDNNPSEEGNLLKSIVEDTKKYHDSLTVEQKRKFNDFWEKVDKTSGRESAMDFKQNLFPWKVYKNELDLAEMHILYNLETMDNSLEVARKNKATAPENYEMIRKRYYSFRNALNPEGIEDCIYNKTGHNQLRVPKPKPAQKMP